MNLSEAVRRRRSVRRFQQRPVPPDAIGRAVALAVQAPAPHHTQPWRFVVVEGADQKDGFARAMGDAWANDLTGDGIGPEKVEAITGRSRELLTSSPLLVVCCADMAKSHDYSDERRRLAEWSLFAHSTGAGLQTFMVSLASEEIASCWISAPVFCRDVVRDYFGLSSTVEPQALVLVGYASPDYRPRPRTAADPDEFIIRP